MANFCSKCGAKQDDSDSKFCIECGASLEKEKVEEKAVVESKIPTKIVSPNNGINPVGVSTILCPLCKKEIPINSNKCPFCNNVINANSNNHVGALITGYLLSFFTLISTFIGLRAVILSLFLMIFTFIVICYLFSRDDDSVNVHAGVMGFLFILSLIIICGNAEIIVSRLESLAHAYYWY